MAPPLYQLLKRIVDYAGLFPPAGLELRDAITNFARYRATPDAWMLNRFVIPVGRLGELAAFEELFAEDPPFRFSVLGTGASDSVSFLEALEQDIGRISAFHSHHDGNVQVEAMEVRWPEALLDSREEALASFLGDVAARFEGAELHDIELYLEVPLDDKLSERLPTVVGALEAQERLHVACKIRCGGMRPEDHPDPQVLAPILAALAEAGVPFKATAGLHHPLRHYNEGAGVHMLGFLNVFGAGVLAARHGLDEASILRILEDEDPSHFQFDDTRFRWMDYSVTGDEIPHLRRFATTFGSCSFDEPREDLRDLELL